LPDGRYKLKVWHYALANLDVAAEQTLVLKGEAGNVAVRLNLRPGAL
jgi:hypothetical protein